MHEKKNKIIIWSVIAVIAISFYFMIERYSMFLGFLSNVMGILQPIIYGLVMAYLINPIETRIERNLYPLISKAKRVKNPEGVSKTVSIAVSMLIAVLFITVFSLAVVPQVIESVKGVINDFPQYIEKSEALFYKWLDKMKNNETASMLLYETMQRAPQMLNSWLENTLLPQVNTWIAQIATIVLGTFNVLKNVVIGIIVALYTLGNKEIFKAQIKKLLYAFAKPETANGIIEVARQSNKIFSGFISGKIVDSLIIGVICFICTSIMQIPYAVLISVIIGVTNIIPFFGPFIGAIPSAILIVLVNPMKGLYFIIFVIILQQVDGNIIGPKILGDSTGLSPFWVLFSILVSGGLFGFVGMIIGVPTFAVIYYLIKQITELKLSRKALPVETSSFYDIESISGENIIKYREKGNE